MKMNVINVGERDREIESSPKEIRISVTVSQAPGTSLDLSDLSRADKSTPRKPSVQGTPSGGIEKLRGAVWNIVLSVTCIARLGVSQRVVTRITANR